MQSICATPNFKSWIRPCNIMKFCLSDSAVFNIDYCVMYNLCVVLDNKNIKNDNQ